MSRGAIWPAVAGGTAVGATVSAFGFLPAAVVASIPAIISLPTAHLVSSLIVFLGVSPLFGSSYILAATGVVCVLALVLARGRAGFSRVAPLIASLVAFLVLSLLWTDAPVADAVRSVLPALVLLLGIRRWPVGVNTTLKLLVIAGVLQALLTVNAALQYSGRVTETGSFALPMTVVGSVAAFGLAFSDAKQNTALLVGAGTVNVLGIMVTQTRGMLLAVIVGTLGLLVVERKRSVSNQRRRILSGGIVIGIIVGAVVAAALYVSDPNQSRFSVAGVKLGAEGRTAELRVAAEEIKESPFIGHGVGHVFSNPIVGSEPIVEYVHNSLAYYLVVGGLVGGGLFVLTVGATYRQLRRLGPDGVVASIALVSLIVFSLTAALQRTLHFNVLLALFGGVAWSAGAVKR